MESKAYYKLMMMMAMSGMFMPDAISLLNSTKSQFNKKAMENLQLALKQKWFDMTKSGEKTEDYREITKYWIERLFYCKKIKNWSIYDLIREFKYHGNYLNFIEKYGKRFENNILTLGYPSKNDTEKILIFKHDGIEIREGNPDWGAEKGIKYFVIKHSNLI